MIWFCVKKLIKSSLKSETRNYIWSTDATLPTICGDHSSICERLLVMLNTILSAPNFIALFVEKIFCNVKTEFRLHLICEVFFSKISQRNIFFSNNYLWYNNEIEIFLQSRCFMRKEVKKSQFQNDLRSDLPRV